MKLTLHLVQFKNLSIKVFIVLSMIYLLGCNGKKPPRADSGSKTVLTESGDPIKLRKVKFLPYWVITAQFAGYFVAEEKGIYKRCGIDISIIPYQPFITSTDLIKNGEVDFSALWLVNAIELKASGADIVNIAQPSTRSSAMFVTKKKSGINTIEKMNGKRAGIWSGFELQPQAFFNKYKLDVKIVPIGSTNNLFLMDGVDITIANWFDEYHSIVNSGFNADELNTFFFADYGLNFLEDGIYCLSDKRKKDPRLCADFLNATLEGWMYAFNNSEEALDIVIKRAKNANQAINRVHQRWMLDRYKDLYLRKETNTFNTILSETDYRFAGSKLTEGGLIKQLPSFENFYQPIVKQ